MGLDAFIADWNSGRIEQELRKEWWLNHGHPYPALYGDDGEMQCSLCPADFKRQPLSELAEIVMFARVRAATLS